METKIIRKRVFIVILISDFGRNQLKACFFDAKYFLHSFIYYHKFQFKNNYFELIKYFRIKVDDNVKNKNGFSSRKI